MRPCTKSAVPLAAAGPLLALGAVLSGRHEWPHCTCGHIAQAAASHHPVISHRVAISHGWPYLTGCQAARGGRITGVAISRGWPYCTGGRIAPAIVGAIAVSSGLYSCKPILEFWQRGLGTCSALVALLDGWPWCTRWPWFKKIKTKYTGQVLAP